MLRSRWFRFASVLLLVLTLSQARSTAQSSTPSTNEALAAAVDAIAANYLAKPGGAGLSIAVARGDAIVLSKGYGLADVEFDVPADAETMFRIGSVTKQFTAALIMKLVEQGKLSLDDTLAKLLPEFHAYGHAVTLRQLLNHTSGIKSYTDLGEQWWKKSCQEVTHQEMIDEVKEFPLEFTPGEKWAYNNTAYYLLGMLIEKASGRSYADALHREIFEPLTMERSRYDSNADVIKNRAHGYTLEGGALVNAKPLGMSAPGAAGGILSTAADLVRWQIALVNGNVVSSASYQQMTTPTVLSDGTDKKYGFGLAMGTFDDRPTIDHGGGINGFNSMLAWHPDDQLHIAVISNGEPISTGKIAHELYFAATGREKPQPKQLPLAAADLARFAGDYHLPMIKLDAKIFEKDGKLFTQATGQDAFEIWWQGGVEFRASFDPDVKIVFNEGDPAPGFTLHQGGGQMPAERVTQPTEPKP
jgi:D-alanyl-D-alanine carboxypeptidase